MTTPTWDTLSIDTAHGREPARRRVHRHLRARDDRTVPVLLLRSARTKATVTRFVPLFAEKFARQRLRALAKVEGLHYDGKPTVLFLCTHNAGRS